MGPVIGEILPLALGIAISPMPIMAMIVMLLSPKARGSSVGFLVGWVAGIALMGALFVLLSMLLPPAEPHSSWAPVGLVEILLGLLLLAIAVRTWRNRPRDTDAIPLPRWIRAIDSLTLWRALAIGFVYSAFRPKNLLITFAAGVAIGSAGLPLVSTAICGGIFVVISASTIAAPVIAFFAGGPRVTSTLEEIREWLLRNVSTITSTALLFLGVIVIGMGIAQL